MKNSGQFTTERLLGNQYAKGNPPNKTSFKPGQTAGEKSNNWKGGLQTSRDCHHVYLGANKRMPRGRYNWIQEFGEIPVGQIVFHIDGDRYNDDIENLELISRGELAKRNKLKSLI